ncbi:MAG: hypothetical protein KDJ35_06285 [Alphaproteobacteria bacterium]|nr:hypothetical protein [Alphaproteobacteria bacterium]
MKLRKLSVVFALAGLTATTSLAQNGFPFKYLNSDYMDITEEGDTIYATQKYGFFKITKAGDTLQFPKSDNPIQRLLWDQYTEKLIEGSTYKPVYLLQADPNCPYNMDFQAIALQVFERAYKNTPEKPDLYLIYPETHPDLAKNESCLRGVYQRQINKKIVFAPRHDEQGNIDRTKLTMELMLFFETVDPSIKFEPFSLTENALSNE